jgi:uncharacterized protein with beta-barrel porin domain
MIVFINYIKKIIYLANNKKYLFVKYVVLVMIFLNHYSFKTEAGEITLSTGAAITPSTLLAENWFILSGPGHTITIPYPATAATYNTIKSLATATGEQDQVTTLSIQTGGLIVNEGITTALNRPMTINITGALGCCMTIKGNITESLGGDIVFNLNTPPNPANEHLVKISGDTIDAAINGNGGSTLIVDGDSTFTDLITISTINIDANTTFNTAVDATEINVATSKTAILNGVVTATTVNIETGSAATINSNSQQIKNIILASGSSLKFGTESMNSTGALIKGSADQVRDSIDANSTIIFPNSFVGGQTQTLFEETEGINGDLVSQLNTVIKNSVFANYVVTGGEGNNTALVTATDKSISEISAQLGTSDNNSNALIQSKNSINASTDTAAQTAFNSILDTNINATTRNFADQVSPPTDIISGSNIEVKAVTSQIQNIIAIRTASLRDGEAYTTGVAAGNESSVRSIYLQGFGSQVEQKTVGDIYGYDAETAGFAVGFDTKTYGGVVFGISYANATTDVTGKGTGSSENKIKLSSGSLYSDYTTDFGYVEGSLTYGRSDNSTSRIVSVSGVNRSYAANYNSDSFSFRLFGGIPFNLGVDFYTTPFIGTTISMIKSDSYEEQSSVTNDALALSYADSTVNSQVGTLGFKFQEIFKGESLTTTAELKLAVNQEFEDDKITNTNTYQGGGTSFENTVDIAKTSGTVGLGLDFIYDAIVFSIGYEANIRDQYLGHSAQAKFTAKF